MASEMGQVEIERAKIRLGATYHDAVTESETTRGIQVSIDQCEPGSWRVQVSQDQPNGETTSRRLGFSCFPRLVRGTMVDCENEARAYVDHIAKILAAQTVVDKLVLEFTEWCRENGEP